MSARENILTKLRAAPRSAPPAPDVAAYYAGTPKLTGLAALKHWAALMRAVRTEVLWVRESDWPRTLAEQVAARGIRTLLLAPSTAHGARAAAALAELAEPPLRLGFDQTIDGWKATLFNEVDAAFTRVRAGIALTGSLIAWPDEHEPRTMSLVPPIHFALFDTRTLYPDFFSAMSAENWAAGMPTNALLISGPSKTSDIQQTVAYGAHGPRELVVLAVLPDEIDLAELEADA
ncbi:L-lactate dehydrogenase complex protein LldG [Crenobacter luteus]|uniref:LutC/YkgG family protein n=1 Tax=Crenobacter luteus TaxID=1452487 RepID=UPI001042E0EA|nr:lactate utilization protein [Crenobacter luteus]TCP14461.1 L-lactate dehydrogenase complex protein LldG [Crenobacter luteus]